MDEWLPVIDRLVPWIEGVEWKAIDCGRVLFRINDLGQGIVMCESQRTKLYRGTSDQLRQQAYRWFKTNGVELHRLCGRYYVEIDMRIEDHQLSYILIRRITKHRPNASISSPTEETG